MLRAVRLTFCAGFALAAALFVGLDVAHFDGGGDTGLFTQNGCRGGMPPALAVGMRQPCKSALLS